VAGLLGERASPVGVFCVACVRRAAPDAVSAGLFPPGSELSMLGERPAPAVPATERERANRDG
jgi:hypothetical protein